MANPLYGVFGGNQPSNNSINQMIAEVQKIQKTFQGNPEAEVKKLIESGQMTQNQFNQFAQIANQIRAIMPK